MHRKKRMTAQFFLTHFALMIPILLTSFLVANVTFYEMLEVEDKTVQRQFENAGTEFMTKYYSYRDESILMENRAELLPGKMIDNPIEAYKGIETLKLKKYFDDRISNVFITYGTGEVYSPTGVASKEVYFSAVLGCLEESVERGIQAMESGENALTFLFRNAADGYLLYSYATNRAGENGASVNFLVSFDRLDEYFTPQYPYQYYELEMKDGSRLVLGSDETGDILVLSEEEWEQLEGRNGFAMLEEVVDDPGITIRLYYDRMSFPMVEWLRRVHVVNIVLIALGVVLSACLSWMFSRKRSDEIISLENVAKGDFEQKLPIRNVYSSLQNLILHGRNEAQELEKSVVEHKSRLQDKIAYMIFGGLFPDSENVNLAFRELNFEGCPDRFFVGAISSATPISDSQLPLILQNCLWMQMKHGDQRIALFLYELEMDDESRLQRIKVAENIRSALHQQGIRKVRIGMSQVYVNSLLIDYARVEAVRMLDEILSGRQNDFCACWDNAQQEIFAVLSDYEEIRMFQSAMKDSDYEEALRCFRQLLYNSSAKECTQQNKIYLRYEILQCIVQYLKEEKTVEKAMLLKECINTDVSAEREFTKTVTNVLHQCLTRKEDDSFTKMLNFIQNNYQNSNLTYEEVAAAGGISKTYISKIFRAKLNMSYIEYLTLVRLEKACMLLRTTDSDVNEIAGLVGYTNPTTFRRAFKDKYGISVTDYRRKEHGYRENE